MNPGPPGLTDCADPFSFAVVWYFHLSFSTNSPKTRIKVQIGFLGDISRKHQWEDWRWCRKGKEAVMVCHQVNYHRGKLWFNLWASLGGRQCIRTRMLMGEEGAAWGCGHQIPAILGELSLWGVLIIRHFGSPPLPTENLRLRLEGPALAGRSRQNSRVAIATASATSGKSQTVTLVKYNPSWTPPWEEPIHCKRGSHLITLTGSYLTLTCMSTAKNCKAFS